MVNPVVKVAQEVSVLKALNGRRYWGPTDGQGGGLPVCDACSKKSRYVYEEGSRRLCYDCLANCLIRPGRARPGHYKGEK